jgi:hypothetical protein
MIRQILFAAFSVALLQVGGMGVLTRAGVSAPNCGGPVQNAVSCWTMETDEGTGTVFVDRSGNHNDVNVGIPANFTWTNTAGFSGYRPDFELSAANAQATSAAFTNFDGSTGFSVAGWIARDSAFYNTTYISTLNLGDLDEGWDLGDNSKLVAFELVNSGPGSNYIFVQSNVEIATGSPQCVVVTWNPDIPTAGAKKAAGVSIYQSGTLITSVTNVQDTLTGSAAGGLAPFIGQRSNGTQPSGMVQAAWSVFHYVMPPTGLNSVAAFCASIP